VAGKGVVQLSGYLDLLLASFLAVGAVGALGWAYTLYVLPVSLFGMSVAAAELPELSRQTGEPERQAYLTRLDAALRSSSLLVVPTLLGYLLFGYLIVATLFRRGSFGAADNSLVYLVLCAYSLGLLATVWSRILGNAFYARGETAIPARIAVARVTVAALAGIGLMLALDGVPLAELSWLSQDDGFRMGAVGLALGSALGATVELTLLRRAMRRNDGEFRLPVGNTLRHLVVAVAATLPALVVWWSTADWRFAASGPLVVGCYAAVYLLVAWLAGFDEARRLIPVGSGGRNPGDS
jgi:putative peptidoglycan lipid II flippase